MENAKLFITSEIKLDNIQREIYCLNRNNYYLKGGPSMRVQVTLACTETGDKNYITTKNKRNNPERLELKKYSPRLKRVTLHRETK